MLKRGKELEDWRRNSYKCRRERRNWGIKGGALINVEKWLAIRGLEEELL